MWAVRGVLAGCSYGCIPGKRTVARIARERASIGRRRTHGGGVGGGIAAGATALCAGHCMKAEQQTQVQGAECRNAHSVGHRQSTATHGACLWGSLVEGRCADGRVHDALQPVVNNHSRLPLATCRPRRHTCATCTRATPCRQHIEQPWSGGAGLTRAPCHRTLVPTSRAGPRPSRN